MQPDELALPQHRFREAYERALPIARALDPADFCQMNVDVSDAVIRARGALPGLQRLRPQAAELPFIDLGLYDGVETYALALTHAQTLYRAISRPPEEVSVLTKELKPVRLALLTDVQALVNRGLIQASLLDSLEGSNGSKNTATDVLVICTVLRNAWGAINGKTAVTLGDLDAAEELADQLHVALGRKLHGAQLVSQAADVRRRMYALFFRAYDEARRVVSFLRWREGDAEEIAPSLFKGRRANARKRSEEAVDEGAAEAPQVTEVEPSPVDT